MASQQETVKRGTLILMLLLLAGLDLLVGSGFGLPSPVILWKLRFPRMLTAIIAGSSLALAGVQMQALFRNPLADPHIMGVSGGAGLGAAIAALTLGSASAALTGFGLAGAAFLGAVLGGAIIVAVSARVKSTGTLLLCGVMLGFVFSALSSVLQYSAGEESLKLFYSWLSGSFSAVPYSGLAIMGGALLVGFSLSASCRRGLDTVLFGDDFAAFSGASVHRIRLATMLGCALMTGAVTAFCGPVGFVGIVAPHVARRVLGTSAHRQVIPGAMLCGSCLALCGDILSHAGPTPLPVGSTLAIIGIPLILVLLWRSRL